MDAVGLLADKVNSSSLLARCADARCRFGVRRSRAYIGWQL